jgi:H+/Cl- antiporter ClcA
MIRAIHPPVIKKSWPDPAWRKVITAAIIAVLAAPALYLIGLWALFAEWLGMGWRFLADSTLVPNWLLVLLTICALIVCGILGTSLRPTRESADPEKGEPPD